MEKFYNDSDAVFILLINVRIQTIVGILAFISRINLMLSWLSMDKFYNLEAFLSEYVLVKQHTAVGRVKRDTGGYDVAFPAQMSFTIGFRNKEYSLDMLRNIHMTSNPAIFTKDGQRPNSTVSLEPLILVLSMCSVQRPSLSEPRPDCHSKVT